MKKDIIFKILTIFSEIDGKIAESQSLTQLHCPPLCGICCSTSRKVEASVIEMLPLAEELFRRGEAADWLERLSQVGDTAPCVFYQPDPLISGNGRCGFYSWRPSVCRLFGFASVKDKNGKPILAACIYQKKAFPALVESAGKAVAEGLVSLNFTDFSLQFSGIDPYLGTRLLPINRAARIALEKYGLEMQMADSQHFSKGDR
jgi:Fe-S-cluster containining protein